MSIAAIVANIDQRLAELDAELTHLNGARSALTDGPASTGRAVSRRAHRPPVKPTYDVVPPAS